MAAMETNNAPDAWDQEIDGAGGDKDSVNQLSNNISALNVNATPFIPGQNVFAKEFVPCFSTPNAAEEDGAASPKEDDAPDDWAEKADENGSTPSDDGGGGTPNSEEMDTDDQQVVVKEKPKKTVVKPPTPKVRKDHLNIVFIGHVDAGKSTIGGHLMYLTGQVDKRTLEKYEKEAKEKNRESWYLSWALDTNLEERDKGKTVEVGRAAFETDRKQFTILDAPGHRSFVPNMIGGASQADVAVLVISARKGEFETGFERGGQTREHAMLVKTAGVRHLIIVVNKMDDPTVKWDHGRYEEIQDKLTPYLKKCGFNPKSDIHYLPVSGLTGVNLRDVDREVCSWYTGPSLITYLDELPSINRDPLAPIRIPIVDKYKDMGTIALGKVESGSIKKGQLLTIMPNKVNVEIMQIFTDEDETDGADSGENVKMKLRNVEEEDCSSGFVLCSPDNLCHTGNTFDAQIVILEHKSIICAGYSAVMHIHTCAEEIHIKHLLCIVDRKTGDKSKTRPRFIKQDQIAIVRLEVSAGRICLESFKDFPQMGRFTLRDEGRTIAIGKVLKVIA